MSAPQIDTAYWKRIDALLEEALALPREERMRWLDTLDPQHLASRPLLEQMLARAQVESDTFMGQPVAAATLDAAAEEVHGDAPGDVVGPYVLIRPLGAGGMGSVWCAERADGALNRQVALKLPRAGWSPGLAERLKRECEILSTLEHPGIARLYDAGLAANGRPYLAMESIDGLPIDAYCLSRDLSVAARLGLFLQLARAIAYAHGRLVVHRDLKPSNILVDGEGAVHVVDFGLAKLIDAGAIGQAALTQLTGRALTPDYASPEQIRGETITVASDVYSLGVVLYELLAGKRPYRLKRESPAALEEAIVEADVPPASSQAGSRGLARALRGDLDTILAKALRKDPAERYPTVEAFSADVGRHLHGEPVLARPDSFAYSAGKFIRRHRGATAAVVAFAVAVLAGIGGTVYQARIAESQARQAGVERDHALRELRFAEAAEEFMRLLLSEQSAKPIAASELLRRAEHLIDAQFADDAQLRGRMQLLLADLYGEVTDYKRAEAVLLEARSSADVARDADALAQIDCTRAGLLAATGRSDQAMTLFGSIVPALESRPDANPRSLAICYSQRSLAYRNFGKAEDSANDARSALKILESALPAQKVNRIFLKTNIGDALVKSGRLAEAVAIYEQASAELARMGRANTSAGLMLANNLIVMLTRAGQLQRAVDVYERATASGSPDSDSTLSINYAKILADIGRPQEAEALLAGALREKVRLGDKRGEAFGLLAAAMAACALPDAVRCEALLANAERGFQAMLPPGHSTFATVEAIKGRIALLRGKPVEAAVLLKRAVKLYEASADRNLVVIRALSWLATAQQAAGQGAAARATAARAVERARDATKGFPQNEWLGSALLAQAGVHQAQGDGNAARSMAVEARAQLAASVGEDTPAVRRADALVTAVIPATTPVIPAKAGIQ